MEQLDAVGYHALASRKKPAAGHAPREDRDAAVAVAATRSQPSPAQRRSEAVDHDPAAAAQLFARTPHVRATDAVEHDVHACPGQAVDLLHEVEMLVVDRNGAKVG